ncbi:hypothetical protein [Mesoterricola sediminis]|uniref:Uncharacterized protein n=1 Tax=Mesoterricola sediminis TaxID=2927980 RepID=A0AA48GUS0_9BACT|nr:hypothetical protein [Mesoterricola sediminis]BDU78159.1 hypothetical protein METESE_31170 [Mesoterricola sediminis]
MARYLPSRPHDPADGFHGGDGAPSQASVGGFWQWAFSNFADNTIRGILAEYLVGAALGCPMDVPRNPWADFDLLTPDGIKVEVKASGRVQSWDSRGSAVVFSGLKGQAVTGDGAAYEGRRQFRADVYVFALQTATHPGDLRPLDLGQWAFWVIPRPVLQELDQRSISLSRVERLGTPATYATLRETVLACHAAASQDAPALV